MTLSDRRRALMMQSFGGLPSIYQKVEYISAASSNGAYIDLGIRYEHGCQYEIYMQYTTAAKQIFGAAEQSGRYRCMMTAQYSGSEHYYFSTSSSWAPGTYSLSGLSDGDKLGVLITMKAGEYPTAENLNNGVITTARYQCGDYTMTRNLYLLGQNYNTGYRGGQTKTVYSFRYWDKDNNLIRDMITCYRKSDGVIGMYDFCSKTFFTNAGSGSFTKGADV